MIAKNNLRSSFFMLTMYVKVSKIKALTYLEQRFVSRFLTTNNDV